MEKNKRTDSGNISSGYRLFKDTKTQVHVHYILDRALSFLSTVVNKLNLNFFDSSYDPDETFVLTKYRTPEFIAIAAHLLLKLVNIDPCDIPNVYILQEWASSTDGNLERYKKYTTREKARELKIQIGSMNLF